MTNAEKLLVWLLRLFGGVTLLALPTVFMPRSWMEDCHEWLGLGAFPDAPIIDYLARSVSTLYAIVGGLVLLVSRDVRRYAAVITYVAVVSIVFGAAVLVLDVHLALPAWWTVGEGPATVAVGVVILLLQAAVRRAEGESPSPTSQGA